MSAFKHGRGCSACFIKPVLCAATLTTQPLTNNAKLTNNALPPPAPRWLIAIAYWLAGGFIKSGLGNRIAYSMVSAFGKTTLGLTYSLVFGEALLSPAIPSVAARAGGIFFPLAKVCVCGGGGEKALACLWLHMYIKPEKREKAYLCSHMLTHREEAGARVSASSTRPACHRAAAAATAPR